MCEADFFDLPGTLPSARGTRGRWVRTVIHSLPKSIAVSILKQESVVLAFVKFFEDVVNSPPFGSYSSWPAQQGEAWDGLLVPHLASSTVRRLSQRADLPPLQRAQHQRQWVPSTWCRERVQEAMGGGASLPPTQLAGTSCSPTGSRICPFIYGFFQQQPAQRLGMAAVLDGWESHSQLILQQVKPDRDDARLQEFLWKMRAKVFAPHRCEDQRCCQQYKDVPISSLII